MSNEIFLFFPGYICLFCQTYHWNFSLLLAFVNIGSIVKPVCSLKLRKLVSGFVLEERLEEIVAGVLVKI